MHWNFIDKLLAVGINDENFNFICAIGHKCEPYCRTCSVAKFLLFHCFCFMKLLHHYRLSNEAMIAKLIKLVAV